MESVPVREGLFTDEPVAALLAARCADCSAWHFPASVDCPYCGGEACATHRLSGDGTLWLFTVVHNRPPGYEGEVPFGFGVVELVEGLRIVTRLTQADMGSLRLGMPVRMVVIPLHVDAAGRQVRSYAFAPAEVAR